MARGKLKTADAGRTGLATMLMAASGLAATASAEIYFWKATSVATNFWDEATNWSPQGVPGIFNGNESMDAISFAASPAGVRTARVRGFNCFATVLELQTDPLGDLVIEPVVGEPNARLQVLTPMDGVGFIFANGTGAVRFEAVVAAYDTRVKDIAISNRATGTMSFKRGLAGGNARVTLTPAAGPIRFDAAMSGTSGIGSTLDVTLVGGDTLPPVGVSPGLVVSSFDVLFKTELAMIQNAVLRKASSELDQQTFANGAGIVIGEPASPLGASIRTDFGGTLRAPLTLHGPLVADVRGNTEYTNLITTPGTTPFTVGYGTLVKTGPARLTLSRPSPGGTLPVIDVQQGELVLASNYSLISGPVLNSGTIRTGFGTNAVAFTGPVISTGGTFVANAASLDDQFSFFGRLTVAGSSDTTVQNGRMRSAGTLFMPLHKGARPRVLSDEFVIEFGSTIDVTSPLAVATPVGSYPLVLGANPLHTAEGVFVINRRYDGTVTTVPEQTNVQNIVAEVAPAPATCPPFAGGAVALNTPVPGNQHFAGPRNPAPPANCVGATVAPDTSFTLEAWVHPDPGTAITIMSHGDGGANPQTNFIFMLNQQGLNLALFLYPNWLSPPGVVIPSNAWTHVAVTVAPSGIAGQLLTQFYVNGVAAGVPLLSGDLRAPIPACWEVYVGRQGTTCNCNFFRGGLDEVRFWNGVRTPQQIQTGRFNTIEPDDSQLSQMRYYLRFDELQGVTTRNHAVAANASNAMFALSNGGAPATPWAVTVPCRDCPSDLNADNLVDDLDFQVFTGQYDILDCFDAAMPAGCVADINNDGVVDDLDFQIFVIAYDELLCP